MWVKTQTGDLVNMATALSVSVEHEENGFLVLASYAELVLRAIYDGLASKCAQVSLLPWVEKFRADADEEAN